MQFLLGGDKRQNLQFLPTCSLSGKWMPVNQKVPMGGLNDFGQIVSHRFGKMTGRTQDLAASRCIGTRLCSLVS
jgi:hypothetical protein